MYPLKFQPIYKEKLWGGSSLEKLFNRMLPSSRVGESWEICCRQNDFNVVTNGYFKGSTLKELAERYPDNLLGSSRSSAGQFPLLLKIIDANDKLSVQVHPDDAYAKGLEGDCGKTEAWYVVSAKENAGIIYGLRSGVTRDLLKEAAETGGISQMLRFVPVKEGDLIFIPSRTVHALMEGIVIYEVQQNSDITYRLYDYDRLDENGQKRPLHIERALDVINFDSSPGTDFSGPSLSCPFFKIDKRAVLGEETDDTGGSFAVYCILAGEGELVYQQGVEKVCSGDSILLPASLGRTCLSGNLKYLKITA